LLVGTAALAAIGLYVTRRDVLFKLKGIMLSKHALELLIAGAIFLAIANIAIGPDFAGDVGLYHAGAIVWAHAYPAVPGLALLNPWYGYSCSYWLYAASLKSIWGDGVNHVAIGLPLTILVFQAYAGLCQILRRNYNSNAVFNAILLIPAVYYAMLYTPTLLNHPP
jgi:hypothetical protein